jgi:hypothetical protein
VTGPDDLSPGGMAQTMSEVLHRPVRFQEVPIEAFTAALTQHGMTDGWAQGLADMTAAQNDGIYEAEPHTPQSATPTSFRQWCEEVLKPAVLA